MDESNNNLVRVKIYGQEYTVRAQADPSYITSVARFVDEKMEEVEKSLTRAQSALRIAILAAMNISDELFTCNKEKDKMLSQVDEKVKFLIDTIDEELNKSS